MESKGAGKILLIVSVLGLVLSLGSGIYYYQKTAEMKRTIDTNLEILYSMRGLVSQADARFETIYLATLTFTEKADGILSALDRFISAASVASFFGLVDTGPLQEGGKALRTMRETILGAQGDIKSFRQNLSTFKTFLETIASLRQEVDKTFAEVRAVIVVVTSYLCLLNIVLGYIGLSMVRGKIILKMSE